MSAQAWPNDGNNKAPKPGHTVSVEDGDNAYLNWLGGKKYMARKKNNPSLFPSSFPSLQANHTRQLGKKKTTMSNRLLAISPWFFTHFGPVGGSSLVAKQSMS